MLALLAPGALLALAVLAVPPLLHLRRRSEQKQVRFAALRWLGPSARPRRQVRLQQIPLLLVRLALFAALVLLLALPVWRTKAPPGSSWAVVTPGLDAETARTAVTGTPAEWRWLATGFPSLDGAAPPLPGDGFSSLLRQFDGQLPPGATLQVVVPQELSGLDAERLQLHHAVEWRIVPGNAAAPQPASTQDQKALKLSVRYDMGHNNSNDANDFTGSIAVVHALAAAWRASGLNVELDEAPSDDAPTTPVDALFWLGATPPASLRQWARSGGTLIAAADVDDSSGGPPTDLESALPSSISIGQGRLLLFPGALDPARNATLRDPRLPDRLLALLRQNAAPPNRAPAASVSPLPAPADQARHEQTRPLAAWVALLAALLFLAERLTALRAARKTA